MLPSIDDADALSSFFKYRFRYLILLLTGREILVQTLTSASIFLIDERINK